MFDFNEQGVDISQQTITFNTELKLTTLEAIEMLKQISVQMDKRSPCHYHKIVITNRINLMIPGRKNNLGDYMLTWDGKPPTHKDVCDVLIRNVMKGDKVDIKTNYINWLKTLDDVYNNGTRNIEQSKDEKEKFAKQLIFWVTLQEEINQRDNLGRQTPFCRYAEALATTQDGFTHTYEEVIERLKNSNPIMLEEWDLPKKPSFYKWRAF